MLRINLLPPEIIERRKWERWYTPVILGGVGLIVVALAVYGVLQYQVSMKAAELAQTKVTVAQLQKQADAFAIFEQREQELAARAGVAQTALASRVPWGQVANNVSLVLPSEVWVSSFTGDEVSGINLAAHTPNGDESMDQGYKSVAKTLVTLASVPSLFDVWTDSASAVVYSFPGSASTTASVVDFNVISKVRAPQTAPVVVNSAVPAPPSSPAK